MNMNYDIIVANGEMRMKKGSIKILPLLLILAIGVLSIRLFVVLVPKKSEARADTKQGVSYLAELEKVDGNAAQNIVRRAQEKYAGAEEKKKIAEAIKKGNYRYAFKNIIISGDSIVKAIAEYGILPSSQVIAEVGAGTVYLGDVSDSIIAANPKYLILHFGENQLSTKQEAQTFTDAYAKRIRYLKKKLPNTAIYVDSIFPVKASAINSEPYLKNIEYYNTCLEQMAKELGVHYIDFTAQWNSYSKNYYDLDGIHPVASYYKEQYLPQILTEVGYKIDKE